MTCHRVELYGFGTPSAWEQGLSPQTRLLCGESAVRHLFRVAAGLESAVTGESEVLGQVRQALAEARRHGVDPRAARLFESAIAAGRAARQHQLKPQTGLAERAVAWLARRGELSGEPVLVVGTGAMGAGLAAAAAAAGGLVTVAGRRGTPGSLDLAEAARRAHHVAAVAVALRGEWSELTAVCTAAPGERLPPVADLSAPPAVPAEVRAALGSDFLGIDQLWERGSGAAAWVAHAEAAVEEEVREYLGWVRGRQSVETLVALRERGESRRRARLDRLFRRLPGLAPRERELVEAMSRQLVTDLLHEPMAALRADPDGRRADAARQLFGLP